MIPNPLSADAKAGGNLSARANSVAESGHDRVGATPDKSRDLDQEGQQFAHLLHEPSEPTSSPVDSQPSELPSGRRLETLFAIPWAPLTQWEARVTTSKEALLADELTDINLEPEQSSGDRILQSLFGQPPQRAAPSLLEQIPPPISSSDRIDRIDQLAERLAQRILVSDRTHTTDSEVRIQLRESVLQGAEITLRHDQGQLVVTFNVTQSDTAGLLLPQTDDLQRALANKLNESVRIEVNVSSQTTGGQNSPGDGRSRNRRDLRDEWDMKP